MPERILTIRSNKPNAATPVKIALQITNKTAASLRFQ